MPTLREASSELPCYLALGLAPHLKADLAMGLGSPSFFDFAPMRV